MNFQKLEQNIVDIVTEQQLKLGYRQEKVRIYYPLLSLNRLLGTDHDVARMKTALAAFRDRIKDRYGEIGITEDNGRFCILLPPVGNAYIHQCGADHVFLEELIHRTGRHGCRIEEVLDLFRTYHAHIEKTDHGEFDYLAYFENGEPDHFRYCLTEEHDHVIYHRFTPEDYLDFAL